MIARLDNENMADVMAGLNPVSGRPVMRVESGPYGPIYHITGINGSFPMTPPPNPELNPAFGPAVTGTVIPGYYGPTYIILKGVDGGLPPGTAPFGR